MKNIIIIIIVAVILALAVYAVYRSKKKGKKCIGCPDGCSCSSKNKKSCKLGK